MKKILKFILFILLAVVILSLIFIPLYILTFNPPTNYSQPDSKLYLSITGTNASTCIGLSFYTSEPCLASVYLGKDNKYDDFFQEDSQLTQIHQFNFSYLEPNTLYHYTINSSTFKTNYMNIDYTFITAPNSSVNKFNFSIIGDTRPDIYGISAHNRVMEQIIRINPHFILNLGDIVYHPENSSDWDNFFSVINRNNYASNHPYMVSVGNHETTGDKGVKYEEYFYFPHKEFYYTYTFSNVFFISLDLEVGTRLNYENISQEQIDWLVENLEIANESQNINWIIATWHVPAFGSYRGNNTEIINKIIPILELYKVDLILSGHNHHYERLKVNNTNYIITGGGGAPLYEFGDSIHPNSLVRNVSYHFCQVQIDGLQLNMTAINEYGAKIDNLTLIQSNPWRI
ncbi:MAG: hypothetical protein EAX96_12495 [Candidatus Lokiarchaeota archaeon]|nr:hypothetical protein [Candidatus Lokiarchaeota archaeon]